MLPEFEAVILKPLTRQSYREGVQRLVDRLAHSSTVGRRVRMPHLADTNRYTPPKRGTIDIFTVFHKTRQSYREGVEWLVDRLAHSSTVGRRVRMPHLGVNCVED